jgi:hypothetical protein
MAFVGVKPLVPVRMHRELGRWERQLVEPHPQDARELPPQPFGQREAAVARLDDEGRDQEVRSAVR